MKKKEEKYIIKQHLRPSRDQIIWKELIHEVLDREFLTIMDELVKRFGEQVAFKR